MNRVAFDVSHLNHEKLSGVGIYTLELLKALVKLNQVEMFPVYRASRFKHKNKFNAHLEKMSAPPAKMFLGGLIQHQAQVLHGPDFRVGHARNIRRVASIMDLAFLVPGMTSPEFAAKKKKDLDNLLDRSTPDALIAISEATKRELINYRPELKERVFTTLLGGDHMQILASPLDAELKQRRPYFLFVGNLEARKNVLGIISAFESFYESEDKVDLLLIGKPGYEGEKIMKAVEASPAKEAIHVLGYCSLSELQSYYRHAVALVYPSWIEGFGIPVVEAMQLHCPVITSKRTSTEEIAGDTGWLVDPALHLQIAEAMSQAWTLFNGPSSSHTEFINRAWQRAQHFTWQRCAWETLKAYGVDENKISNVSN